ncbi:MAG TPA: hypothetical protein PKN48_02955 [Bacteroidales bacterium]|nr:hypothetical protein [Bacteroidales bacterium]
MTIVFHIVTAIGVTVILTDTAKIKPDAKIIKGVFTGLAAFIVGLISHAALDYSPHCYPAHSKIAAIVSLLIIITFLWVIKKPYKLIAGLSFLGCSLPDIIDRGPAISKKLLGHGLPISDPIFPMHWHEYSGLIYYGECWFSTINQIVLVLTIGIICWFRRADLKRMIKYNKP